MSLPPRLARAVLAALAGALVASCTATPGTPRDGADPSEGASPGGSTASSPSGTALTAFPPVEVVLTPALRGNGGWEEVFRVPWGPGVQQLGVSDDHDGQAPRLGPDGGAPTGRGTWWFTDTHKLRLVEVDRTGRYLRQLPVPGPHMDATLLHVFDDGRMWASNGATGENSLWADGPDGPARRADASDSLVWSGDDGAAAYARGNDGRSYRLAVTARRSPRPTGGAPVTDAGSCPGSTSTAATPSSTCPTRPRPPPSSCASPTPATRPR